MDRATVPGDAWIRSGLRPVDLVNADRLVEPLQSLVALVHELQVLAQAQLAHAVRYQDLVGLSASAQPRGELHAGAEEILVLLDRLSRAQADLEVDRHVGILSVVGIERLQ